MRFKLTTCLALSGWALLGTMLTGLVGCGSGGDEWTAKRPKVYAASGVVMLDGKPLEGAVVQYMSQSHDLAAAGTTDAAGKYSLTTFEANDGAVEGPHKVVVKKTAYEEKKTKYDSPEERSVALMPKELLPARYANSTTTPLEVTVTADGPNEATLEVKSK